MQVPPAAIVPPVNNMDVAVAIGAKIGEPHPLVVAFGAAATRICAGDVGKVSVNARPVSASFGFGFVIVNVNLELPPASMGLDENNFVILGGCKTVSDAVALPVEPVFVPPFVEEINPLTFWCGPEVVPLTLTLTVQELLAAMEPPFKLILPPPAASVSAPPQELDVTNGFVFSTPLG